MVQTPPQNGRQSLAKEDLTVHVRKRGRRQQSWRNQVTDFLRRNTEEDMAEDRHLWRLGVDGRLSAEQIQIIIIIIFKRPRRILEWFPPGRPRNSWMQEVTTGMREGGIVDLEWVDREGWRKKINLPQAQKTSKSLYK